MLRSPPPAEGQLVLLRGPMAQLPPEPMVSGLCDMASYCAFGHTFALTHTYTHTHTHLHTHHTIPHSQCTHIGSHIYILSHPYILIIHVRSVTHILTIYSRLHTHNHQHPHAGLNFAEQSSLPSAQEFSSTPVPLKRFRKVTSRSPCP